MELLLHTCCAPCLVFPLHYLKQKNIRVTPFFYNPNIHPFREFKKRLDCLVDFSNRKKLKIITEKNYGFVEFNRNIVFKEKQRCSICYDMRLEKTVLFAKKNGFTSFSSTLLYSKYQRHSLIKNKCEKLAEQNNLNFMYYDFRDGWQEGIDQSIADNLYRQPYCGCIYSEQERYDNRLKKQLRKQKNIKL